MKFRINTEAAFSIFAPLAFWTLLVLRLTGTANIAWYWILAPLFAPGIVFVFVGVVLYSITWVIEASWATETKIVSQPPTPEEEALQWAQAAQSLQEKVSNDASGATTDTGPSSSESDPCDTDPETDFWIAIGEFSGPY